MDPYQLFIEEWDAFRRAQYLAVGSYSLLVYEYILTLNQEISLFWTGRWSISRALFFLNRYLTLAYVTIGISVMFGPQPLTTRIPSVPALLKALTALAFVVLIIVEMIHAIRLWHLFSFNRGMQTLIALASFVYTGLLLALLIKFRSTGDRDHSRRNIWVLWIPTLFIHTLLYALTVARALYRRARLREKQHIVKRLILDGGQFYAMVVATVCFVTTAASSDDLRIQLPALSSNFMFVLISLCMSRVLFSIRSLAANLSTDPDWMLSNLELSRVHWRRGASASELVVTVENQASEDDYELSNKDLETFRKEYVGLSRERVGAGAGVGEDSFGTVPSSPGSVGTWTIQEGESR